MLTSLSTQGFQGFLWIFLSLFLFPSRTFRASHNPKIERSIFMVVPPSGCYLHIPFCRRRCFYCDFPVKIIGDRKSTRHAETDSYTQLLLREISTSSTALSKTGTALETIYFGGGTPSLLSVTNIEDILSKLSSTFGIQPGAEITLEMDPGTFDKLRLEELASIGINRVSMGVQSFDDTILQACGRAHSAADVYKALEALSNSPIGDNFSIDLMSSLPGVSPSLWKSTLQIGASSGCNHISVYDLQVEDRTAFGRWYTPGVFPLPTEELSAKMYETAVEVLSSQGFEHYEVSNYAKPGKRSRHNQKYWSCQSVWGFGLGAASFVNGIRYSRPTRMEKYTEWVNLLERVGFAVATTEGIFEKYEAAIEKSINIDDEIIQNSAGTSAHIDNFIDKYTNNTEYDPSPVSVDILEILMCGLRTSDGIQLASLTETFGRPVVLDIIRALQPYIGRGLVLVLDQHDNLIAASNVLNIINETAILWRKNSLATLDTSFKTEDSNGSSSYSNNSNSSDMKTRDSNSTSNNEEERVMACEWNRMVRVRLSDPSGFLLSNDIISSVFASL